MNQTPNEFQRGTYTVAVLGAVITTLVSMVMYKALTALYRGKLVVHTDGGDIYQDGFGRYFMVKKNGQIQSLPHYHG